MAMPTLIEQAAALAQGMRWGNAPGSAQDATERCTLQVLATTYLGARREVSQQVASYVRNSTTGPATMCGLGSGYAPAEAAFANATMCHADFRDDSHAQSQSHPGVTVIPAALATAELTDLQVPSGTFGSAVLAGYQVIGRLGRIGAVASTGRGFRASAIYTVFGAAAASGVMLGLDDDQMAQALALAAQGASGLNQPFEDGTDDWILLPGQAARAGVIAALLAREGVRGSPHILEGGLGFFRAYCGLAGDQDLETPGAPAYEVEVTRLKSVLTCGWNQASTNALLAADLEMGDITEVEVTLSPEAHDFPGVANPGPFRSYTEAVLSSRYALGSLLATGMLEATSYDDLNDARTLAAAERVKVGKRESLQGYDTEMQVRLRDGSVREMTVPGGEPQWLLTTPEVVDSLRHKFRVSKLDVGKVDDLVNAVRPSLGGSDLGQLIEVLGAPA